MTVVADMFIYVNLAGALETVHRTHYVFIDPTPFTLKLMYANGGDSLAKGAKINAYSYDAILLPAAVFVRSD